MNQDRNSSQKLFMDNSDYIVLGISGEFWSSPLEGSWDAIDRTIVKNKIRLK